MATSGIYRKALSVIVLGTLLLSACTPIPVYQFPESSKAKAYLSFEYTENNFSLNLTNFGKQFAISSVGKISLIDGPLMCAEIHKNPRKLFVLSHGNPLISDLNKDGAWVEAERKLIFHAMSIPNPKNICGRVASFTPKAGGKYVIHLDQSEDVSCSVNVSEIIENQNNERTRTPVADFQLESCVPRER